MKKKFLQGGWPKYAGRALNRFETLQHKHLTPFHDKIMIL